MNHPKTGMKILGKYTIWCHSGEGRNPFRKVILSLIQPFKFLLSQFHRDRRNDITAFTPGVTRIFTNFVQAIKHFKVFYESIHSRFCWQ